MNIRYTNRTVEWGHWGITFADPQPDLTKNYGIIRGTFYFPVGPCGPADGLLGSAERRALTALCSAWVNDGLLPDQVNGVNARGEFMRKAA